MYVKGEMVGGCDILMTMHSNGDLEKLLLENGILEPESDSVSQDSIISMVEEVNKSSSRTYSALSLFLL